MIDDDDVTYNIIYYRSRHHHQSFIISTVADRTNLNSNNVQRSTVAPLVSPRYLGFNTFPLYIHPSRYTLGSHAVHRNLKLLGLPFTFLVYGSHNAITTITVFLSLNHYILKFSHSICGSLCKWRRHRRCVVCVRTSHPL